MFPQSLCSLSQGRSDLPEGEMGSAGTGRTLVLQAPHVSRRMVGMRWVVCKPRQRSLETPAYLPHDFAGASAWPGTPAKIISDIDWISRGWLMKMYPGHAAHISLSIFLFLIKTQRSISAAQMLSRSTDTLIWSVVPY